MKLSVKTDYAARAVLELAAWPREGPVRKVEDLATAVGTSANYLVQILIELKGAGLVDSVRGKQGGYRLAKGAGGNHARYGVARGGRFDFGCAGDCG